MRLDKQKSTLLKSLITEHLPKSDIYLFGSRADNSKKGGDIDILILADRELKRKEKASIEFDFFKKFGEQKLDLVSYRYDAKDSFKEVILEEAVAL
jgi:predicted nucleotidyltransferase